MDVEHAREAMVAFLDQFIERGAASDVIALRDRLRDQPDSLAELSRHMPAADATSEGALEALRALFTTQVTVNEPGKADLIDLYSWTSREADGGTSDPAQWDDWLDAVHTTSDH